LNEVVYIESELRAVVDNLFSSLCECLLHMSARRAVDVGPEAELPSCRIHQTLRVTMAAMAARVTKRLWEMTDLVEMLEAWEDSGRLAT
jgi:hypothetical protein